MANSLFKQSMWIYALTYFGAIGAYLTRVLLTQNFSPEEFGFFYATLGLFALLAAFNDLGLAQTLNYFGIKWYEAKKYAKFKTLLILSVGFQSATALLISAGLYFYREFLIIHYFKVSLQYETLFVILLVYFLLNNLAITLISLANVLGKYEVSGIYDAVVKIVIVTSLILLISFFGNIEIMGYAWVGAFLVGLLFLSITVFPKFIFINKVKANFSHKLIKTIFSYSMLVAIGTSAALLMTKIDVLFLTYFINVAAVGYYELALAIANITAVLITPISSIIFPITTKYIQNRQKEKLNHLIQIIYRFYFILAVFLSISFLLFADEIITFLFGSEFLIIKTSFLILTGAVFFQIFTGLHFGILAGLGKVKERNKCIAIGGLVNVCLNFILISHFKITGVAIATFFTFTTMYIYTYHLVIKNKLALFVWNEKAKKHIFWIITGAGVFALIVFALKSILLPVIFVDAVILNKLIKICITSGIGTCCYFGILWYGKVIRLSHFKKHFGEKIGKYIPDWL